MIYSKLQISRAFSQHFKVQILFDIVIVTKMVSNYIVASYNIKIRKYLYVAVEVFNTMLGVEIVLYCSVYCLYNQVYVSSVVLASMPSSAVNLQSRQVFRVRVLLMLQHTV